MCAHSQLKPASFFGVLVLTDPQASLRVISLCEKFFSKTLRRAWPV